MKIQGLCVLRRLRSLIPRINIFFFLLITYAVGQSSNLSWPILHTYKNNYGSVTNESYTVSLNIFSLTIVWHFYLLISRCPRVALWESFDVFVSALVHWQAAGEEIRQEQGVSPISSHSHFDLFSPLILFEISAANTLLPLPSHGSENYSLFVSGVILFLAAPSGV